MYNHVYTYAYPPVKICVAFQSYNHHARSASPFGLDKGPRQSGPVVGQQGGGNQGLRSDGNMGVSPRGIPKMICFEWNILLCFRNSKQFQETHLYDYIYI